MFARITPNDVPVYQARIDAIVAAAREHDTPCVDRPPHLAPSAPQNQPRSLDRIDQHLEEELATLGRTLNAIGDRLSDDPILLNRYASLLQALDNAAQTIGHLATIVGAANRHHAAMHVPVGELRARLLRGDSLAAAPRLSRSSANPFAHQ